jgi:hypothetical protein
MAEVNQLFVSLCNWVSAINGRKTDLTIILLLCCIAAVRLNRFQICIITIILNAVYVLQLYTISSSALQPTINRGEGGCWDASTVDGRTLRGQTIRQA